MLSWTPVKCIVINWIFFFHCFQNNITPLHVASRWGKAVMVTLLLDNKATIDERTRVCNLYIGDHFENSKTWMHPLRWRSTFLWSLVKIGSSVFENFVGQNRSEKKRGNDETCIRMPEFWYGGRLGTSVFASKHNQT
jgi:hypothetical protein